jgi:hypothetical protein
MEYLGLDRIMINKGSKDDGGSGRKLNSSDGSDSDSITDSSTIKAEIPHGGGRRRGRRGRRGRRPRRRLLKYGIFAFFRRID